MSRGITRRTRQLLKRGTLARSELTEATHEAELLGHPYVGPEHFRLAELRRDRRDEEYKQLRASIPMAARPRWWKPLGRRSALRQAGLAQTRSAQQAARQREDLRDESREN
jgi:hypothetical protein